jgi:hypothetical protein
MKTIGILLLALIGISYAASAAHIRGGELTYRYVGPGAEPGTSQYELMLKLYVDCNARGQGQLDNAFFQRPEE